jgi:hemerythrin-like metal-binding protein
MPLFEWDDSMNLGDAMIDRQHKTLVDLINKVHVVSQSADRDVEIMHSLTSMYLYAKEHFFDEEGLMDRLGYPGTAAHKAQHRAFVEKTHALTDACLEGDMDIAELSTFLITWLRNHIAVEDVKILRYASDKGASEA